MKNITKQLLVVLTAVVATSTVWSANLFTEKQMNGKSVLATPAGLTLYTFDIDKKGQASSCAAACAEKWPPYIITDDEAKNLPSDQGVIVRASGLKQLTYDGKLVYLFYQDRTSTDTKGDGVGGVWHIIAE